MNWQFPLLLAQQVEQTVRERLENQQLADTQTPESALARPENSTSNPFVAEYWFPEQASSFAGEVDFLFMAIFWISLIFFIGIVGVMFYFCYKYRRIDGVIDPQPSTSHNTAIEILWSVIPSLILVWMFYYGANTWFKMRVPRDDAEEIQVTAYKYGWQFTYPDGDVSSELHLVMDRPTKLVMQSKDVLHSMFVPAFRQKVDVVPGRYTYAYFKPTKQGVYRLSCNEYCGDGHSKMRTAAIVHLKDADRKAETEWIPADHSPAENGRRLYNIHCAGCHKIDGQAATGPALNLIWGEKENLMGGKQIDVDENYIKSSILYPDQDIVAGYGPVSKMNSFKGILDEAPGKDIDALIAFIRELKEGIAE
ncbi:MAG: cytochrome c oxidase subunit II [Planctomycetota bacterium]